MKRLSMKSLFGLVTESLILSACPLVAATGGPDSFGYAWNDAPLRPPLNTTSAFEWIDITASGQLVIQSGNNVSSNHPALGIGSPVTLGRPFTFYGETYTQLVPAVDGYLSSDPAETGADNTNDCPLPKSPSHGGGARIYGYHDDLILGAGSGVYYQYLAVGAHPLDRTGVSIFTWENVERVSNPGQTFDFQILLFDDGDILFQYRAGVLNLGASATIGIQNAAANVALSWSCNTGGTITGNRAVHFLPPMIVVNTVEDQNDFPRGSQVSLREAIRDIPVGGKIGIPDSNGFVIRAPASLPIQKTLSISSEETDSPFLEGVSFTIGGGARVIFNNVHFRRQPGNGFAVGSGAKVKFTWCRVDSSPSSTLSISGGGHVDLHRTAILHGAIGSSNMIVINGGSVSVIESLLAHGHGHALSFSNGGPAATPQIVIQRSSLIHHRGEGLRGGGSRVWVRDSTISANEGGSGINLVDGSILDLDRSVLSRNSAGLALDSSCSATVTRSIIAGNRRIYPAAEVQLSITGAAVTSGGHNLLGTAHASFGTAGDVVAGDPKLAPVAPKNFRIGTRAIPEYLYAHSLLDGSVAIDGAGLTSVPAAEGLDIRGQPRVQDGGAAGTAVMDIGPLEMGPQVRVTTAVDENNGLGSGAGISLREALAAHANPHVVFSPSLSGLTIVSTGSTFVCGTGGMVDASSLAAGITLDGADAMSSDMLVGGEWNRVSVRRANLLVTRSSSLLVLADGGFSDNTNDVVSANSNNRYGGAVYTSGYTFMSGCRFTVNRADNITGSFPGGAVACREYTWEGTLVEPPSLYLLGCRFDGNYSAGGGGALHASSSVAVVFVSRCHFADNESEGSGGAVRLFASPDQPSMGLHHIQRSSFVGNGCTGGNGAAIAVTGTPDHRFEIGHCTLHGNFANENAPGSGLGGAVFGSSAAMRIDHATVTGNGAVSGGAIWTSGTVEITNSAFADNFFYPGVGGWGDNFLVGSGGAVVSGGYNLSEEPEPLFSHPTDPPPQPLSLEPPFDHGDGTVSRHPLAGSPLLDSGSLTTPPSDQRALPGRSGTRTDIGAVEALPALVVTTAADQNDSPAGAQVSLREAIRDTQPGQRIQFNVAAMGGSVIDLSSGANTQLDVGKSIRIDAGNTPGGITVKGPSAARVMNISASTARVFIDGLSFRDGNASLSGGAIRHNGALLRLSRSALYQNNAASGAALLALAGETYLENVTIAANFTDTGGTGGAILVQNSATVQLDHCTVADNTCTNGGAIDLDHTSKVSVSHSVFATNLVTSILQSRDFFADVGANIESRGRNRVDSGLGAWAQPTDTSGFSDLEGLSDYGGLARICRPGATSFVRDAAPVPLSHPSTDARGFLRIHGSGLDLGAAELNASDLGSGTDTDNDGMPDSWESGFSFNPNSPVDAGLDADGDGQGNLAEYQAGTHPRDATSVFRILSIVLAPDRSRLDFTWSSVPGRTYTVWHSTGLSSWTQIDSATAGMGQSVMARAITNPALLPSGRAFIQVRVTPP